MKKLLIVLMLLPFTVSGADWCATFGAYRNTIKQKMGLKRGYCSGDFADTLLNDYIREGVIHVVDVGRLIKKTYSDTTTFHIDNITLDTGCLGVEKVWLSWSAHDSTKDLTYMPRDKWYQLNLGPLIGKRGNEHRPSYYEWSPLSRTIWLHPAPAKMGDTIKYDGWRKVPSIAATDSLAIIPQNCRGAVLAYVTYLVARATSDPRANDFKLEYIGAAATLGFKDETVEVTQ